MYIENYEEEEPEILEINRNQDNKINYFTNLTDEIKVYLFNIFWYFLGIYTSIDLYFNKKKVLIDSKDNKLVRNSNYNYYKENELISSNKHLTNRKNYDLAICEYKDRNDIIYNEIILPHNRRKKKHKVICDKHFMSIYFTKDDNEYEININDNTSNFYLVGNIIDYNVIKYLMFYNYNIDISNIKFNVVIIDNDSNVIILKETNYIVLYKHKYSICDYTE